MLRFEKLAHVLVEDNDKLESLHQLYNAKGGDAVEKKARNNEEKSCIKI